jgi:hypothetical protein
MDIGGYFQNMIMGGQGDNENSKKGTQELWKIYQQAYNVKPVWNGKAWVMPPGAIQRFQMLLPLIQAQMNSNKGQGAGANDKGILGPLMTKGISGFGNSLLDKAGGWGGIVDKIGGGVKGLWDSASQAISPLTSTPDMDLSGFNESDISPTPFDNVEPAAANEDWWSAGPDTTSMDWLDSIPIDDSSFYDYTENFW